MFTEHAPAFTQEQESEAKRFHDHWALRHTIKDLRDHIQQSALDFPHRQQILQITNELMSLVPPVSDDDEVLDNRNRQIDRNEIVPLAEEGAEWDREP